MRNNKTIGLAAIWFLSLLFAATLSNSVSAIGILLPSQPEYPALRLTVHKVEVDIQGNVARTKVEHIFHNSVNRDLEGMFIFPIPKNAEVTNFALWINGKKMEGEVLEKDKARNIYEDIVRRAKDPGLLELIDTRLFRVKIYPIPAYGDQKVEIEYTQVLKSNKGLTEYSYSMSGRLDNDIPGAHIQQASSTKNSFNINIRSNESVQTLYSPTHKITDKKTKDNVTSLRVDEASFEADKDFKLFFKSAGSGYGVNLANYRPDDDEPGYFMMIISPKQEIDENEIEPKSVSFVLDVSGSMLDNKKIDQAKKALLFCLRNLGEKDFFNIITFSTDVKKFSDKIEPASKNNKEKAEVFIDKLKALGGTNIHDALLAALNDEAKKGSLHVIVFITDGQPTIGITNPDDIISSFKKQNNENVRIFTFGVGYDVNTKLLDSLAEHTNSYSDYIAPNEDMEVKISDFYSKIQNPVLTNLKIKIGNVKTEELYPKRLPDLFAGSDILVFGRYKSAGNADISLSGFTNGKEQNFSYKADFDKENKENDFIEKLWASRKIGYLLEEIKLNGEKDELREEVVELAKKYNIVTPYTSYLVVEDSAQVVAPRPMVRAKDISQGINEKSTASMYFNSQDRTAAPGSMMAGESNAALPSSPEQSSLKMTLDIGKDAVDVSRKASELKGLSMVSEKKETMTKSISGKTFTLQDNNEWLDSDIANTKTEDAKTIKIKVFSKAYFELISMNSEAKKIASVGEKIRFTLNGWLIIISDEGVDELPEQFKNALGKTK